MATKAKSTQTRKRTKASMIDPIYQKFSKSVVRTLGSTEFYEFFMDAVSKAHNQFQFSNRRLEKLVDLTWVDAIDEAIPAFQNIIANPRNRIREDELIVNVAHAKKAGADVVRHLAQHSSLVEDFNVDSGDVRPSKLMQKYREDTTEMYENRLAFTVLENAYHFVRIRHEALFEAMHEEYGAKLKVESNLESATELIHYDMFIHVKEKDSALETDEKNREVFARIDRIHRLLTSFMMSEFAEQLKKVNRVKGTITKTNVLKKNPNYKKIVKLWEFLRSYDSVGYMIKVTEQNPQIDEVFQRDIYHNIMFQYIILKGYLEDENEREIPAPLKERKRKLKPKVIRSIIEELVEDYDIPDVEIRKVLIEELTKEQLMLEEEGERRRLVEEAEARKREEEEKKRLEELAEKERLKQEEEAEAERLRLERKAEEKRLLQERMEQELEDRRRTGIFKQELEWFEKNKYTRLMARQEALEKQRELEKTEDFINAAKLLEEEEARQREQEKIARQRQLEAEEKARLLEEKKKEEARLAMEAELEKIRAEKLARQIEKDMKVVGIYLEEAKYFFSMLEERKQERVMLEEEERLAREEQLRERQLRQEKKQQESKKSFRWRFGIR